MRLYDREWIVFDLRIKAHNVLGSGLLENAYEECLYYEIHKYGLFVEKQKALPLIYEDIIGLTY